MSEYWVSTPKYWCKFCKAYVRDTPFDKRQHDSTPKHQGNIQRSLRTMHKEHEREGRDQARAQAEVARLNGIVSGSGANTKAATTGAGGSVRPTAGQGSAIPRQAVSMDERKRQMKQLADMGVAVPEEFRADIALAGDWQTLAQRRIEQRVKDEDADVKSDALSIGVRKRRHEGAEEEEEAGERVVRKGWGSTTRDYPGSMQSTEDIGALLKKPAAEAKPEEAIERTFQIKKEEGTEASVVTVPTTAAVSNGVEVKPELVEGAAAPVFFKKRKGKALKAS